MLLSGESHLEEPAEVFHSISTYKEPTMCGVLVLYPEKGMQKNRSADPNAFILGQRV